MNHLFSRGIFSLLIAITPLTFLAGPTAASGESKDRSEYKKISPPRTLTEAQAKRAASNYQKYCALCHGENREGYKNDHAPSLKSRSLLESGVPHAILRTMNYGRSGTAMGGYLDEVGGPLSLDDSWDLTYWLFWQENYDRISLTENPVRGDTHKGARLFREHCASCHGENGQGFAQDDPAPIHAPKLANPDSLAYNKDDFYRYAIEMGREGTPMPSFKDRLTSAQINDLTAYIRSLEKKDDRLSPAALTKVPEPKDYILNKNGKDPTFPLKDGDYVLAKDLYASLQRGEKMVLLDTRVPSVWQRSHIEGAVPVPYYTDVDKLMKDIPKDVMIVSYCSCPRAASEHLVSKLKAKGYTRTSVMWEGIFGWMKMGYPVVKGDMMN